MTAAAAHVRVAGLSRDFDSVPAVRDLDFDVEHGELFGVVGPDGAGKTTLLRMLAGVLRPTRGDALIGGVSVRHTPERVKPHLAYMSQRFGLYTDLTVAENLAFYADLYRVPRAERAPRLARLYDFSGLKPFQDRLAGALSGGMKQKLGLSAALIHQPALLLLDEPTFGVDPISRRDLWLLVHEMVADGTTVIVSTAYLDEAERCDRVLLLAEGARLALDRPERLQAALAGRVFEVWHPDVAALRSALVQLPVVRRHTRAGQVVRVITGDVIPPESLAVGVPAGARVRPGAASFEDVFMDLLGGAHE